MFELFQKNAVQALPNPLHTIAREVAERLVLDEQRMTAADIHKGDFARLMAALPASEREVLERVSRKLFDQDLLEVSTIARR